MSRNAHTRALAATVLMSAGIAVLPAPTPTPIPHGKPDFYHSCTANLSGVGRLSYPMCNASLLEAERVADFLARATLAEKSKILSGNGAAIPRLGMPVLHASEATHGVASACGQPTPSTNGTGCVASTHAPAAFVHLRV